MTQTLKQTSHCYKSHARKRLRERYGVSFDNGFWNELKGRASEAIFISRCADNPNRVIRFITFKGHQLLFVWDKISNEIVTFLPLDMLNRLRGLHA